MSEPDNFYDGTNPFLSIIGDEPNLRDVSMTNNSFKMVVEPLTNTQIPAGQTVLVRVQGDIAYDQLLSNIEQINALEGFEVVGLTSIPVEGGEVSDGWLMTNCTLAGQVFSWSGGTLTSDGQSHHGYHASTIANIGSKLTVVAPNISNIEGIVLCGARLSTSNTTDAGTTPPIFGLNLIPTEIGVLSNNEVIYTGASESVIYTLYYKSATEIEQTIQTLSGSIMFNQITTVEPYSVPVYFNILSVFDEAQKAFDTQAFVDSVTSA